MIKLKIQRTATLDAFTAISIPNCHLNFLGYRNPKISLKFCFCFYSFKLMGKFFLFTIPHRL